MADSALGRLISDPDRSPPRRPEEWVRVSADSPAPATGAECILRDREGQHFVGVRISEPYDPFLEIRLLGCDETRWFEIGAVTIGGMPSHRWIDRREVIERQRRGEPAAVRVVVQKPPPAAKQPWSAERRERFEKRQAERALKAAAPCARLETEESKLRKGTRP